jgi:hypothetical protein
MSSSNTNKARNLSLYCPDLNKEVFNFILTPSMTWDDIMVSIQAALQCQGKEVWPLDINGEPFYDTDAAFNFASIQDGEELFVKLREGFRITALPDLEVVLYLEEEDPDALPKPLKVSHQSVLERLSSHFHLLENWCRGKASPHGEASPPRRHR